MIAEKQHVVKYEDLSQQSLILDAPERGKIRYIGGRCIAKVRFNHCSIVRARMLSIQAKHCHA